MAEDEASGSGSALSAPPVRTLKIPCLVTGVGYTFTLEVDDNVTITRFRELVWNLLLHTINENPRLPVMTAANHANTTIEVDLYVNADTTGCIRKCLDWIVGCLSKCRRFCCVPGCVQGVSSGLTWFRVFCCGEKRPRFSLYFEKGPTKRWLTMDDSFTKTLKRGCVSWPIKWLVLCPNNMIQPGEEEALSALNFPDYGDTGEIFILIHNAPLNVKDRLRVAVENDIRYYKMEHAQGRARFFAWLSLVCLLGFGTCGVLNAVDKDEGTKSATADLFRTIERIAMFAFAALAGLLLKFRDNCLLLSETLEKRIDYSKIVGVFSSSASVKASNLPVRTLSETVEDSGEP